MRIVQNNSGLWCQRKTIQFHFENENSAILNPSIITINCEVKEARDRDLLTKANSLVM